MLIKQLKNYIKEHGKSKTAVALGLLETQALSNWISRRTVPKKYEDKVKELSKTRVTIERTA